MASFNGKWKLVNAENLDLYLDAIEVSPENKEKNLKSLSADNGITQVITVEDTKVTIKRLSPIRNWETTMEFGKEQDQPGFHDERNTKVVCTLDGKKLIENLTGPFTGCNTRTVDGDSMTMTMTSGTATAMMKYKRV